MIILGNKPAQCTDSYIFDFVTTPGDGTSVVVANNEGTNDALIIYGDTITDP